MPKLNIITPPKKEFDAEKGDRWCQHHGIPVGFPIPTKDPITGQEGIGIQQSFGFVSCVRETCALWNREKGECWDVTKSRATAELAETQKKLAEAQIKALQGKAS